VKAMLAVLLLVGALIGCGAREDSARLLNTVPAEGRFQRDVAELKTHGLEMALPQ
jgi:hypothetical protein